jgi:phage head maturation protease
MDIETIIRRSEMQLRVEDSGGNGSFSGAANVTGRMDSYGSVIFPGAFVGALDSFVARGWIAADHEWDLVDAVGQPTAAREVGVRLEIEGTFHSSERAQTVRTIASERRGPTGFSVGFRPDWDSVAYFETGQALLDYAAGLGADLSLFDPALRTSEGYCWAIPTVQELREVSFTLIPANDAATVDSVRSALDDLREGSRAGLTLESHLDSALAVLQGVTARLRDYVADRAADGRQGSPRRGHQIRQLHALSSDLERVLERGFATPPDGDVLRLQMQTERLLSGV